MEPSLKEAKAKDRFQFDRHGYFFPTDKIQHRADPYLIVPLH
jgi:hypothetical protein